MDREQWNHWIEAYGSSLQRVLTGVLADRSLVEDAWQETWFSVWQARERIRSDRDPWGYIRATGLRKALDQRRGRRPAVPLPPEGPAAAGPVREAGRLDLTGLPVRERACLVLHFFEGMAVSEIAQALEVPVGTVKTWMHRGRERLRQRLGQREGHHDLR